MKAILYAAISIDGFLADPDGDAGFVSVANWDRYRGLAHKFGNVVMGRKTYEAMRAAGKFPVPGCLNVVMTKRRTLLAKGESDRVLFTSETPVGVIRHLTEKGLKNIFLGGGGKLFGSFLKEGLVDEFYLTIEPTALGRGVPLFGGTDQATNLKLVETFQLSENEIQLHFRNKKPR